MSGWVELIVSLPTRHATERMRVWRALKASGCGVLRDGVYLLPANATAQELFARQAQEVHAAGGQAYVLQLGTQDPEQELVFRALFDRTADYAVLKQDIERLRASLKRPPASLGRDCQALQKRLAALQAVDFFPDAAQAQVSALLEELLQAANASMNPHEPHAVPGKIKRLDRAQYQGRTWATRKHLWVDRMASAWLIARFIDEDAKFKWLNKPEDCPKKALGFDFDGAAFTHIGNHVTFEVLLASFGLEEEAALLRLAGIVHFLDIGGVPVAEAAGLEAVLKGLRDNASNDDELMDAASSVFNGLYAAFSVTK